VIIQRHVQTIEKTGKQYKAMMAVGVLLILIGGGMIGVGISTGQHSNGLALLVGGFALYLLARIAAWWNHG
jgi:hypothetical protein